MQTEEEIVSSSTMMDPCSLFLYGMKAPMTREKYRGRVVNFIIHPTKLSGLHQAIYITKCLGKGEYPDQIIEKFEI